MVHLALIGAAALIATAPIAILLGHSPRGRPVIYGISLIVSLALLAIALFALLASSDAASIAVLPLGLPWLGAHFRLDALAAYFLAVVSLGNAAASTTSVMPPRNAG